MADDGSIKYARDLSEHPLDEPRNKRGQTLGEYIETLRGVFAALKGDMFYHMSQRRQATNMADYDHHDKAMRRVQKAMSTARKRAAEHGIRLD